MHITPRENCIYYKHTYCSPELRNGPSHKNNRNEVEDEDVRCKTPAL